MRTVLLVGTGGAAGALLRALLASRNRAVPWGTLAANLSGSLLLGLLVGLDVPADVLLALGTGVTGGLTTFSTFALEVRLLPVRPGLAYLAGSVAAGLSAAAAGVAVGRLLS